ncbi:MAG: UDP-N-acetylmuramate dehydrogenase, partial [Deltaproteobacteria bacterium]|nr:UDP-N-acetylmuramate dehydrogenase [Deltaproteobacteria bacterium]
RVQEGEIRDIPTAGLDFGYRRSALSAANGNLALEGVFALESLDAAEMARREKEIQQIRRETQPRENPNCGSVFKNPPGHFAARLIQEAGLKGTRLGEAQISLKHANFIVNLGQATAADVLGLITIIQKTVKDSSGVELETEVQVIR